MKMIAGAILRALANRSRTRAAPTPTSDSTNSAPDTREERRVGLTRGRPRQQRLAGAGRADEQHALGRRRPERQVLARVLEVVADLAQLDDGLAGARDVVEGDAVGVLGAALAPLALEVRERRDPARAAVRPDPREEREQADEQQDRDQELHDDRLHRLARLLVDDHHRAALLQRGDQRVQLGVRARVGGPQQPPVLRRDDDARVVVEHRRREDLLGLRARDHGRERHALARRRRLRRAEQGEERDRQRDRADEQERRDRVLEQGTHQPHEPGPKRVAKPLERARPLHQG